MELKYIQNKDLTEEIKTQIIQIKEEHWHYGDTSQRKWLKDNLLANDVHLLGYSGGGGISSIPQCNQCELPI